MGATHRVEDIAWMVVGGAVMIAMVVLAAIILRKNNEVLDEIAKIQNKTKTITDPPKPVTPATSSSAVSEPAQTPSGPSTPPESNPTSPAPPSSATQTAANVSAPFSVPTQQPTTTTNTSINQPVSAAVSASIPSSVLPPNEIYPIRELPASVPSGPTNPSVRTVDDLFENTSAVQPRIELSKGDAAVTSETQSLVLSLGNDLWANFYPGETEIVVQDPLDLNEVVKAIRPVVLWDVTPRPIFYVDPSTGEKQFVEKEIVKLAMFENQNFVPDDKINPNA